MTESVAPRIAFVEDSDYFKNQVLRALSRAGFTNITWYDNHRPLYRNMMDAASNGTTANAPFDFIISDNNTLDAKNGLGRARAGIEFIRDYKRNEWRDIPVALFSSDVDENKSGKPLSHADYEIGKNQISLLISTLEGLFGKQPKPALPERQL